MKHGVTVTEQATAIFSPVKSEASIPFFIGCAPVHKISGGSVNRAELCYTYADAVALFGVADDFETFGISEAIYTAFKLYGIAPIICVNVFDPEVHRTTVAAETITFGADNKATLAHDGVLEVPVVTTTDDATTYVAGTDYTFTASTGVFTRLTTGSITTGASIKVAYVYGDPTLVTKDDIIGGIDVDTGAKTGLSQLDECYPRFGLVPETVVVSFGSLDTEIVTVATTAATNINGGMFKAVHIVDLDDTVATKYSAVNEYKNLNNLTDPEQILCWGKLALSDTVYRQSTHLACLIQSITADNGGVPYESPSNKSYQCDALIVNGKELLLGPDEADYLTTTVGVVTALNIVGGWKCWGNRTAAYPSNTDVKDCFIVGRQMFHWISKEIVLTYWQKLDKPMSKRLIEAMVISLNVRLNGLTSRQYILGGRVEFNSDENPVTDLINGAVLFHVYFSFPVPNESMTFMLEYDANYLSTLFA